MKTCTILAFVVCLICMLATASLGATVVLQWTPILDPGVTKINVYHTKAANCTALVPQTPMVAPWSLVNSVTLPATTDTFTEWSGTWCWYATTANATDESPPSNVVSTNIPLARPVLTFTVTP